MNPRRGLVLLALLLPAVASATPMKVGYQGRLTKSDGAPETGVVSITFSAFSQQTGGSALWTETQNVGLAEGFYSVVLGDVTTLPETVFTGEERFLELSVGGVTMTPRQRMVSVPYALQARVAKDLSGGVVDATAIKIGGQTVIDGDGKLAGAAQVSYSAGNGLTLTGNTFALTACSEGQILKYGASGWACGADGGNTYAAAANGGLTLSGTDFGIKACSNGQVMKFNGTGWDCGIDLAGDGTVVAVTASAPLESSGGASTNISLKACPANQIYKSNGTGWACVADATNAGTVTNVTGTAPVSVATGTSTPVISMAKASATVDGYLAKADFDAFAKKVASVAATANAGTVVGGSATAPTVGLLACTNGQILKHDGTKWACNADASNAGTVTSVTGTAPVSVATGTSTPVISMAKASATVDGYLGHTDFDAFAKKVASVAATANAGVTVGGTATAPTVGLMACTVGQVLRHDGTKWACAADYIQNQTGADQVASFRINGTGALLDNLYVGASAGIARLNVTGAGASTGAGTFGVSGGATTLNGGGTSFNTQLSVGDIIKVTGGCTAAPSPVGQERTVLSVPSATSATIDSAFSTADQFNCTYSVQKPIARAMTSTGNYALIVSAQGKVGVNTNTPLANLDVNGTAKIRGGLLADYDSGWVAENSNTTHTQTLTHNLGVLPTRCMMWLAASANPTTAYPRDCYSNSSQAAASDYLNPLGVAVSTSTMTLNWYGSAPFYQYWNGSTWSTPKTGYVRVLLWK